MKLSIVQIQRLLAASGYYKGGLDGELGPKTLEAAFRVLSKHKQEITTNYIGWPYRRRAILAIQLILKYGGWEPGALDGFDGVNTLEAYRAWDYYTTNNKRENIPRTRISGENSNNIKFPSQSQCVIFYGKPGSKELINSLKMFDLPLPMRLDFNLSKKVNRVQLHEKCGKSGIDIIEQTVRHYGETKWRKLGLDRHAGTYALRKMRGGKSFSMHAYGCAWDFFAGPNGLRTPAPIALFSGDVYIPFFNIVEAHGWLSLGRTINRDWMHIQATSSLK